MSMSNPLEVGTALIKFYSRESLKSYVEALLRYYRERSEEQGRKLSELLREHEGSGNNGREAEAEGRRETQNKGWFQAGKFLVNLSNPKKAEAEAMLKVVEDFKGRTEKTAEALKSFGEIEALNVSGEPVYLLFVNRGVCEAIIIDSAETKPVTFAFAGKFRVQSPIRRV